MIHMTYNQSAFQILPAVTTPPLHPPKSAFTIYSLYYNNYTNPPIKQSYWKPLKCTLIPNSNKHIMIIFPYNK